MPTQTRSSLTVSQRQRYLGSEQTKGDLEVRIFRRFVQAAALSINPSSIEKRTPPEPDILCKTLEGDYLAFELVELCDPNLASAPAKAEAAGEFTMFGPGIHHVQSSQRSYKSRIKLLIRSSCCATPMAELSLLMM